MRPAAWVAVAVLAGAVAYALSRPDVRAGLGAGFETITESVEGGIMDFVSQITGDQAENRARWLPTVQAAEADNGLPAGLLDRVLYQESHYRADIIEGRTVSGAGAVGIAQIVPRWHPDVDPLDTAAAIHYAARYLAQLNRQFGAWPEALAAYNWGPGNLAQHGMENLPAETREYVASITSDVGIA